MTEQPPRLRVLADLSGDLDGSIEVTVRATDPDTPVYVYDPVTGRTRDGVEGRGPVVLAVDNLPAEFPRDASEHFGDSLFPFLNGILTTDDGQQARLRAAPDGKDKGGDAARAALALLRLKAKLTS